MGLVCLWTLCIVSIHGHSIGGLPRASHCILHLEHLSQAFMDSQKPAPFLEGQPERLAVMWTCTAASEVGRKLGCVTNWRDRVRVMILWDVCLHRHWRKEGPPVLVAGFPHVLFSLTITTQGWECS